MVRIRFVMPYARWIIPPSLFLDLEFNDDLKNKPFTFYTKEGFPLLGFKKNETVLIFDKTYNNSSKQTKENILNLWNPPGKNLQSLPKIKLINNETEVTKNFIDKFFILFDFETETRILKINPIKFNLNIVELMEVVLNEKGSL